MLGNLESDLKKVLLAGIGALATTVEKSKDIVDELVKKGEITVEQGKALNEELKHDIQEQKEEKESAIFRRSEGRLMVANMLRGVHGRTLLLRRLKRDRVVDVATLQLPVPRNLVSGLHVQRHR